MTLTEEIEKRIIDTIDCLTVQITSPDDKHFKGIVVSSLFEGKSLVEQHQIVMNALKELFSSSLHAFELHTYTPAIWEKNQGSS